MDLLSTVTVSDFRKQDPDFIPNDPARLIIKDCPKWWRRDQVPVRVMTVAQAQAPRFDEYFTKDPAPKMMGLVAYGPPGGGKTSLMLTIFTILMARYKATARYVKVRQLIREFRNTWGKKDGDEIQVLKDMSRPKLLLIDDVGVQAGTENERNLIYDVVAEREDQNKPTFMTTNLILNDKKGGLEEFSNCVDPRVVDRYANCFIDATDWGKSLRRMS